MLLNFVRNARRKNIMYCSLINVVIPTLAPIACADPMVKVLYRLNMFTDRCAPHCWSALIDGRTSQMAQATITITVTITITTTITNTTSIPAKPDLSTAPSRKAWYTCHLPITSSNQTPCLGHLHSQHAPEHFQQANNTYIICIVHMYMHMYMYSPPHALGHAGTAAGVGTPSWRLLSLNTTSYVHISIDS